MIELEKQFVSYKQSVALKKLEYDEPCLGTFAGESFDLTFEASNDEYFTKAPLKQQVFSWAREKHGLHGWISRQRNGTLYYKWIIEEEPESSTIQVHTNSNQYHGNEEFSFEQAENSCIDKLIKIIKTKK